MVVLPRRAAAAAARRARRGWSTSSAAVARKASAARGRARACPTPAGGATGRGTAATPSTAAMTSYSPTRSTSTATRAAGRAEARRAAWPRRPRSRRPRPQRLAAGGPQLLAHRPRREGVGADSVPRVQNEAAEVLRGRISTRATPRGARAASSSAMACRSRAAGVLLRCIGGARPRPPADDLEEMLAVHSSCCFAFFVRRRRPRAVFLWFWPGA